MLTYLINVTDRMLVICMFAGIAVAYAAFRYGKTGRIIVLGGAGAGMLAAVARSIIRNTVRYQTWRYSVVWYAITLIAIVCFIVFSAVFSVKAIGQRLNDTWKKITDIIGASLIAIIAFMLAFLFLPTVYAYPFDIAKEATSFLSTECLLSVLGFILGIAVCVAAGLGINKIMNVSVKKGLLFPLTLGTYGFLVIQLLNVLYQDLTLLTPRGLIQPPSLNKTLFNFTVFIGNNLSVFTYLATGLVVVTFVYLIVRSKTLVEPYNNPAVRRKHLAAWRAAYRSMTSVGLSLVIGILCFTWFVALNTVTIEEAPVEECDMAVMVFGDGDRFYNFTGLTDVDISSADYLTINDKEKYSECVSLGGGAFDLKVLVGSDADLTTYSFKWYKNNAVIAATAYGFSSGESGVLMENQPVVTLQFDGSTAQEEDCLLVPIESVADGHLHRFGFVTDKGFKTRFIVVKKTNSSSYGVGLDACDICGEAGYYEKSGQIVCRKCDVVMNVNTIGFKGGCNPIVIDFAVDFEQGYIIVPTATLIDNQTEFK
mgnify:CR=1 FL=1